MFGCTVSRRTCRPSRSRVDWTEHQVLDLAGVGAPHKVGRDDQLLRSLRDFPLLSVTVPVNVPTACVLSP